MAPKHMVETVMSYGAGALYAVGFWMWVDATVISNAEYSSAAAAAGTVFTVKWYQWIPFVVGTLAIFMINLPPHSAIFGDTAGIDLGDGSYTARIRVWLFVSLVVAFGAIAAAIWMAAAQLLKPAIADKWPGAALIISNALVFASALVYRFQRAFEEQDDL
jgi:hypothetical protein